MAKFKKLPKKPKKTNLTKSSLETLKSYETKIKEWIKACSEIKKYNDDLKKARLKVKNM